MKIIASIEGREENSVGSTMNFGIGQTVSNGAVVNIGRYGQICAYASAPSSRLLFDILGYQR